MLIFGKKILRKMQSMKQNLKELEKKLKKEKVGQRNKLLLNHLLFLMLNLGMTQPI